MRHKIKTAACMALLLSSVMLIEASAAPPQVTYDETLYVNLDSYGKAIKSSIVKSYGLNSNTQITDYGKYSQVINMTDYTQAQESDDGVSFDFSQSAQTPTRFYFEGKDPELVSPLPWDFDVSYKLNGVPYKAEDLPGASGLIEINIDAIPNENAIDYYKNNFMLEAACVVDIDNTLSVEAPGSQMVTVGSLKTIVFFALPGEEQHFQISIGSNDFEFSGIMLMMQPATMSQVDKITDLRDAKNDIEDSADAISDSLDVVLDTLDAMQSGLQNTSDGLKKLDEARNTINESKGGVYEEADTALSDMEELSKSLEPYSAHFDNAQKAVNDINDNLNSLNDSLQNFSDTLSDIKDTAQAIDENLDAIDELITTADEDKDKWSEVLTSLSDNLDKFSSQSENLETYLKGIELAGNNLGNSLEYLSSDGNVQYISDALMEAFSTEGDVNAGGIWATLYSIQYLASDLSALSKNVGNLCGILSDEDSGIDIEQLINDTSELSKLCQNTVDNIYSHSDDYHSIIENSKEITEIISDATDKADETLNAINASVETANKYKADIDTLIADSKNTVEKANKSLTSLHSFLTKLEDMIKTSGESLNAGTEATINGLVDVLAESISGLSQTNVIKNAKDTIKDLADSKWDEYTGEDNNLLNLDSSLPALSFTSDKNSAPESVQVILRTEEITADDEDEAPDVNEDTGIAGTPFTRIVSVFKKIFGLIKSFFS